MIGRPARCLRRDPVEPQIGKIERINERVDHANRIAFIDPVFKAFRQQRRLRAFRPRNEALGADFSIITLAGVRAQSAKAARSRYFVVQHNNY
jgi:hypothetical protein